MFGFKRIVLSALVGGGAVYFADHYHVVHTVDGLVVVPRSQQVPLRSAYADVRGWDTTKWAQYPELSESMIQDGRSGLLIDGTADGFLREIGNKLGLPSSTNDSATPVVTDRPPIVFESPLTQTSPAPANVAPAADDSLLGRLSRQLQGASSTSTPTIESRPLSREVPTSTTPLQPAYQPPQQPLTNERASVPAEQFPQDLLPSIHSAAMQRITSELSSSVGGASSNWTPAFEALQTDAQNAVSRIPNGTTVAPSVIQNLFPAATQSFNSAGATGSVPLPIDAQRLKESLPTTIQEQLLRQLHTEPSAGLETPVGRSL
ncbi:MAG: hypothetical protein ACK5Q5_04375 [Planctomycetaceae bacterium]